MEQTNTGVTADSPAASSPSALPDLSTLAGPDLEAWRLTGKLPESTTDAASSADQPADQAASTEVSTPPASETGTPKVKGIKARHAELDTEITALQDKLKLVKGLRQQVDEAAASQTPKPAAAAAAPKPYDGVDPADKKPLIDDFETVEAWADARDEWNDRRVARKSDATARAQQAQHAEATRHSSFAARLKAATDADPTLAEVLATSEVEIPADGLVPDYIKGSPNGIAMMKHLATHPEHAAQLRAQTNPWALHRALVLLEHAVTAQAATPGAKASTTPPTKTVSDAPEPPPTLGQKPTGGVIDTPEAAIARGDAAAYNRLMNQRELAASAR